MLYVKSMTDDYTTIQIEVTDENTYTRCCDCGCEMQLDLNDAIIDGYLDMFGTRWRCDGCSYKHALKHRGEPWAEQVIKEHRFPLDD